MSRWARLLVLCVIVLGCGGCLRYHAELRVDAAGIVSGRLIVAVKADLPANLGQQSDVPLPIRDRVTVAEYRADGYVGSTVSFDRLSLEEVGQVFGDERREGALVQLSMARTGDRIALTGAVSFPDLSLVGNNGFDARIALTFTGASRVTGNGAVSGDQVTWTPQPGRPLSLSAEAVYPQPTPAASGTGPRSGLPTAVPVALVAALIAVLAGGAALLARRLARRARGRGPDGAVAPGQPSGWQPTLPLPTDPLPRLPAALPPADLAGPPAEPVAAQPTDRLGPYAGRYPMVPPGPGLSPERTRGLPADPPPGGAERSHRRDRVGR
jgi:hypothetical protein